MPAIGALGLAIEQALADLLKAHHTQDWIGYQIQTHREYQKHFPNRGRPKESQKGQLSWKPYFFDFLYRRPPNAPTRDADRRGLSSHHQPGDGSLQCQARAGSL